MKESQPISLRRFLKDRLYTGIITIPVIAGAASGAVNMAEDEVQIPPARIEYFKLTVKTLLDTDGDGQAGETDAPLDLPVQAWLDEDRNGELGMDEGVVEYYTPNGDGTEEFPFLSEVDLGGWQVCAEATIGTSQNLEPVSGGSTGGGTGKGCAEFDAQTKDAKIQLLFRHPSTPTPAPTPSPTPAPTASSSSEPPSPETPILTPAAVPLTGGVPNSRDNLLTVTNLGGLIAAIAGLGIIKRVSRK